MRIALPYPITSHLADALAQEFSITHLQAEAQHALENGLPSIDLVISDLINQITHLAPQSNDTSGFVLNNFPGNITQAQALDVSLAAVGQPLSCVLMFNTDTLTDNRDYKKLNRYYRTQNKLILIDSSNDLSMPADNLSNDTNNLSEIYAKIRHIYEKRRIR